MQIIYDPQNPGATNVHYDTAASAFVILGSEMDTTVSMQGHTTQDDQISPNADGSVDVSISTSSLNGFAGSTGGPQDPILLNISLTFSPDGTVDVSGGQRSGFPSLELWTYQVGQDPFNLLAMQETKLSDLGSYNQEIPEVSNDPSKAQEVVSPDDIGDQWDGGLGEDEGGGDGGGDKDVQCPGDDEAIGCFARLFRTRPFIRGAQHRDFPEGLYSAIVHGLGFRYSALRKSSSPAGEETLPN